MHSPSREHRFNSELLAERLAHPTRWLGSQPDTSDLRICYFGAGTGSAAALIVDAKLPERATAT